MCQRRNAKIHDKDQVARIAASMAKFGWTVPCMVADDGELIAGHGRVLAAIMLGLKDVPVIRLGHLDEAERRAYRIADNKRSRAKTTFPNRRSHRFRSWATSGSPGRTGRTGKVLNDDRADWREAWALFPGDVAYVWHGALHAGEVADSLAAVGFAVRSQIIWAKDRLVLSRGDYHWQHKPCWYAVRVKGKGHWAGDRKQTARPHRLTFVPVAPPFTRPNETDPPSRRVLVCQETAMPTTTYAHFRNVPESAWRWPSFSDKDNAAPLAQPT